jgi:transposase InsO family protein
MPKVILTPEQQIRQRARWFELAAEVGSVTVACERCGISRKTYYKWRKRFQIAQGAKTALLDQSRRPHQPRRKVKKALRRRLLTLRQRTHLGPARLRALLRAAGVRGVPSAATIAKVVKQAGLTRKRRAKPKRYRRVFVVPRPGDLVQLDVKWVPYLVEGRQLFQFTAIDCCTRLRLVSLAEEMTISTAKAFAQYVLSTFPFPIQIVQTDNDSLFTHWYTAGPKTPLDRPVKAHPFTLMVESFGAIHRLIPPRTPRLNGRVERSHQTDEQEFYQRQRSTTRADLRRAFARWLWHYNHTRVHTGAGMHGRTPLQVLHAFTAYRAIKRLKCYPC